MNKEQIYDAEIAPLMDQIIAVCKANKIAMLASFHIPTEEDEHLNCTTYLLSDEYGPPESMLMDMRVICPPARRPLMVTTRETDGKVVRMEAIL